jgi:hypothetical protein
MEVLLEIQERGDACRDCENHEQSVQELSPQFVHG